MHDKVYLEDRRFILISMRSKRSNHSKDSKRSNHSKMAENADSGPEVTTPYYGVTTAEPGSVVTSEPVIDTPVEPMQSNGHQQIATLTTVTTLAPKEKLPPWLIPGTWDWKKLVERVGLQEVNERRQSALKAAEVHL